MNKKTLREKPKISKKDESLTQSLALAISHFDIIGVGKLLSDTGEFQTYTEDGETVICNKPEFLKWLDECFGWFQIAHEDRTELSYHFDQCLYCRIGNPVIIFENGRFPVYTRDYMEKEKIGLMLEFKDGLISDITLCGSFLNTDNCLLFDTKYKEYKLKNNLE